MQTFEREVCQRLPLADSVFRLLDFCIEDGFLNDVFDRHRGRSYEDILTFPQFVQVISDTLLRRQRSASQHFQDAQDQGTLPVCVEALYGKLRRIPLPLSQGLLGEATCRLRQVFPNATDPLPRSLDALEVYAFDGKKIKFVAKRLKCLRVVRGQILGGKLLVAQHVATGLAVALQADADGEASDNSLVADTVAQVRQYTPGKAHLWVGDRAFCDLKQIPVLKADGDHFLLRYHPKTHFHRDEGRAVQTGVDSRNVPYTEEWGWLGAADNPNRQYVRRITLHRHGAEAIILVTDLLDGVVYPAADLLETYRRRWGIEKLFQRVTEVFDLRHLIGSTPQATVFQAAFCFLLANVIQTIQNYVAEAQECQPEEISTRLLFEDVVEELTAWQKFLSVSQTLEWLRDGVKTPEQVMAYLRDRLAGAWKKRWRKAKAKKPQKEKPPTRYLQGGHSSVYRIQRNLHELSSDPSQTNP
jgi:Transposase DDE domain